MGPERDDGAQGEARQGGDGAGAAREPAAAVPASHSSGIISDCLTGLDGITYDPARIYGAIAVLTFIGLAIYAVVGKGQAWDAQAYGIGFGTLLAGFGLGVGMKRHTEPGQQ